MSKEEPIYSREYMFHGPDDDHPKREPVEIQMAKKIAAFEEIGLRYDIKRGSAYGTGTPTWNVKFYRR